MLSSLLFCALAVADARMLSKNTQPLSKSTQVMPVKPLQPVLALRGGAAIGISPEVGLYFHCVAATVYAVEMFFMPETSNNKYLGGSGKEGRTMSRWFGLALFWTVLMTLYVLKAMGGDATLLCRVASFTWLTSSVLTIVDTSQDNMKLGPNYYIGPIFVLLLGFLGFAPDGGAAA